MPNLIVWDIKTVPDLKVFAKANSHKSLTDAELRAIIGSKASSPFYCSIVCLSMLIVRSETDGWIVDSAQSFHVGDYSERDLIKRYFETIADLKPRLVSFQASTLLEYRAMRHKLALPRFCTEPCNVYEFDELPLCDFLSRSAQEKMGLREACALFDLPYVGLDDAKVEEWFGQQRWEEITVRSEREVASIFRIWLRYELLHGRLSYHGFNRSDDLGVPF
jgi:predicted PolB exonuclease-like 3'-5' exonuclease